MQTLGIRDTGRAVAVQRWHNILYDYPSIKRKRMNAKNIFRLSESKIMKLRSIQTSDLTNSTLPEIIFA